MRSAATTTMITLVRFSSPILSEDSARRGRDEHWVRLNTGYTQKATNCSKTCNNFATKIVNVYRNVDGGRPRRARYRRGRPDGVPRAGADARRGGAGDGIDGAGPPTYLRTLSLQDIHEFTKKNCSVQKKEQHRHTIGTRVDSGMDLGLEMSVVSGSVLLLKPRSESGVGPGQVAGLTVPGRRISSGGRPPSRPSCLGDGLGNVRDQVTELKYAMTGDSTDCTVVQRDPHSSTISIAKF
ncbi:hypothetical protein EVAR_80845_1 [Eumeta japonica]|uniref:Uncharacterized protein n=1 Tax=Eumeta variegata TaxID=151549 RepID=A0A4C1V0Q8_EUMVA|nr:hypothetical protein EVAR_80845_1 [Eumeta japonica]